MKINRYLRHFIACATMIVTPCVILGSSALAGVEMKVSSIEKTTNGDTIRTTTKYAPVFRYSGSVTLPSAVDANLKLTLGKANIKGVVILKDNMPPKVSYSLKFDAASDESLLGNVEAYRRILRDKKIGSMYADAILKQHESCHVTDAATHPAIALLALEPSISVKDAAIQQRLDSTRAALLKAMEARAVFVEALTGTVKKLATERAYVQAEIDRLVAEGVEERYAIYVAMEYHTSDPVVNDIRYIQERCDQLGISVNIQQLLTDFYGEPVNYGNLLLDKLPDEDWPSYDVKGSPDQLDDYVFSITQADALDQQLGEHKVNPAAKLAKAVREYEQAVKDALIAMCKTEICEEKEETQIEEETDTITGESQPIVISCDLGKNSDSDSATVVEEKDKTDKNVPQEAEKPAQDAGAVDVDKDAVSVSPTRPLPQLLPDTDDFEQLLFDTSYNELEKLSEILNYVTDAESAAAVVQGGEASLLNRWLAQYYAKVKRVAEDKDKDNNEEIVFSFALYLATNKQYDYPGKMVSLRNDKFVPALDRIYGNDCFGNKELHRQLLNINNETKIFVDGKMKPIYTIRDYAQNVRVK